MEKILPFLGGTAGKIEWFDFEGRFFGEGEVWEE